MPCPLRENRNYDVCEFLDGCGIHRHYMTCRTWNDYEDKRNIEQMVQEGAIQEVKED